MWIFFLLFFSTFENYHTRCDNYNWTKKLRQNVRFETCFCDDWKWTDVKFNSLTVSSMLRWLSSVTFERERVHVSVYGCADTQTGQLLFQSKTKANHDTESPNSIALLHMRERKCIQCFQHATSVGIHLTHTIVFVALRLITERQRLTNLSLICVRACVCVFLLSFSLAQLLSYTHLLISYEYDTCVLKTQTACFFSCRICFVNSSSDSHK